MHGVSIVVMHQEAVKHLPGTYLAPGIRYRIVGLILAHCVVNSDANELATVVSSGWCVLCKISSSDSSSSTAYAPPADIIASEAISKITTGARDSAR